MGVRTLVSGRSKWQGGDGDDVYATTFEGVVLGTYEKNWHDDSDFVAVAWDDDAGKVVEFEYASTRYAGGNAVTVDATDEVRAKADAWFRDRLFEARMASAADLARVVAKGSRVQVVKGRKVAVGTTGVVFWKGVDTYKTPAWADKRGWAKAYRVGVETDAGDRVFLSADNVEVVDPVEPDADAVFDSVADATVGARPGEALAWERLAGARAAR